MFFRLTGIYDMDVHVFLSIDLNVNVADFLLRQHRMCVRGSKLDANAILALAAAAPRLRKLHVSVGQTDAAFLA